MSWLWWLGGALVLGVVEMLTVDLIFLMFAGGALGASVASLLGAPVWGQVITFVALAALLLGALRPWALARMKHATPRTVTNVAAHVGRSAEVVDEVTDRAGRIKLVGEVWSARAAEPGDLLPVGSTVQVVRIEGATAVVAAEPLDFY